MVGQRLTNYLQSCGLEAEDVPKVAAIFLGAKYCAWAASVAVAVRYQPLRRVFLSRREALFGRASGARTFSERKRLWLVEALDMARSRRQGQGQIEPLARRTVLAPGPVTRAKGTATAILKRLRSKAKTSRSSLANGLASGWATARDRYHAANYSWKLAGWQLLRTQERQKLGMVPARHREPISWYSWTSARYWQLSDKLAASAGSNRAWSMLTKWLNLNSKGLALGLAEGTILFKFTVPVHMPLMLFTIVSFFRHRRWVAAETTADLEEDSVQVQGGKVTESLEEPSRTSSSARNAARDISYLGRWGLAFWQEVE
mmetsp:Transcript_6002/g.14117  ORF Transcript_6002/g.14117 Transcript_6002/m.14117 type:complete len:316 (-) Transcript_6002:202-1149(-)